LVFPEDTVRYCFENYSLDPDRRELRKGTDLIVVEPQVFDLLEYLIRHRERVASKNDVFAAIWHGRIVSDSALTTRLNSARAAIGDSGDGQRLIKTLRGKGFRFVGVVEEDRVTATAPPVGAGPAPATGGAGDDIRGPSRPALPLPDRPAIAVLPFTNMTGDPGQEYFSDGITEDIITELSRYPDLFVVARNSSFTYRGKAARVTAVARELGVHYVLEGSVQRAGNRLRVNAQLAGAAAGMHLWAQRYDRDLEDVFSIKDEVVQNIVAVLPARIQAAAFEQATRKMTSSWDAYDHLLRGKFYYHRETPEANREAEAHFDRAIELDPRFASAYAWRACVIGQALRYGFLPLTSACLEQSIQFVEQAMSIDENNAECHRITCRIALIQGRFAKSEHHLECALELNPNDPQLVVQRGINLTFSGDPEAAIPWIERAMRLDPFSRHRYHLDMVRALFMAGRPAEATIILERAARAHWEHYLWRAACHAAAGKEGAAKHAGQEAVALRPNLSISAYIDEWFAWRRNEDKARLSDALAQAGLPP
jgi:TolB-like protein/DNA-binding winged helix-turn-helix (wHTH) protein/tetratricopeptide (TPR) repeat protein